MGRASKIPWTDHSYSPWHGCAKTSPGCANCWAERQSKRFTAHSIWGPKAERRFFGYEHWQQPLRWNKAAAKKGISERVFCGSMCDVFEIHQMPNVQSRLNVARAKLWAWIENTHCLDWLLLTKRPQNVERLVPVSWLNGQWPKNAWLGVTAEDQERAEERVPVLLKIPAPRRFVSVEPMLDYINMPWVWPTCTATWEEHERDHDHGMFCDEAQLDWVICGGESGPKARPLDLRWVRRLRDECVESVNCKFFFKQMMAKGKKVEMPKLDGKVWDEIPESVL
jgi:protein gp37